MSGSLVATVALAIVILAVTAGLTARQRSARVAVTGLGLVLLVVGGYFTGVTDLIINGVVSLIDWFRRTVFTTATAWGIGLAVAGVLALIVASFLPKRRRTDAETSAPRVQEKGRAAQRSSAGGALPAPAPRQTPAQKGLDPEDAEIEALLRKRGIM